LTATLQNNPQKYNLIGIINEGDNFHYGFINNPDSEYTCRKQDDYYIRLNNRINLSDNILNINKKNNIEKTITELSAIINNKDLYDDVRRQRIQAYVYSYNSNVLGVLLYVIDIFSFVVFDKFFNNPNEESQFKILKELCSILVNNPIPETVNISILKYKYFEINTFINFIIELINGHFETSLINFIINRKIKVSANLNFTRKIKAYENLNFTPVIETDEFKCFFYVLSKLTKQHPFKNCKVGSKKIVNPNVLYTQNTINGLGLDVDVGNVQKILEELYASNPNRINKRLIKDSYSVKNQYTYIIDTSGLPYYISTEIQKDGLGSSQQYMCIIAINVTAVDSILENSVIDREKLITLIESNKQLWEFVTNVKVKQPQLGGDPDQEPDGQLYEVQCPPISVFFNKSSFRKNKTLRSFKNVKRVELWG